MNTSMTAVHHSKVNMSLTSRNPVDMPRGHGTSCLWEPVTFRNSSDLHQTWPHDGELIRKYADIFQLQCFYHILKLSS